MKKLRFIIAILISLLITISYSCAAEKAPAATPKPAAVAIATVAPAPKPTTAAVAAVAPAPVPTAAVVATVAPAPKPTTAAVAAAPVTVTKMTCATTYTTSGYYPFFVGWINAVNTKYPGEIQITAAEGGGTATTVDWMAKGRSQMGMITSELIARAYYGILDFKDNPKAKDIRVLWYDNYSPIAFIVTKLSGITSISQLNDKPFGVMKGSAAEPLTMWFFETIGIKPRYYAADAGGLADATLNRQIVGFTKGGIGDATIMRVAVSRPITILPISRETIDNANNQYAGQFVPMPLPPKSYPDQDKEVLTFGYSPGVGVLKDVPADVVYKICKAGYEKRKELAATVGQCYVYENWPEYTLQCASTPLHVGVVKFLRELNLKVPDNIIPPEMK